MKVFKLMSDLTCVYPPYKKNDDDENEMSLCEYIVQKCKEMFDYFRY